MPTQDDLLKAVGDRMLDQIGRNATSDTILKLAEAWAWIHSPEQSHGSHSEG